MFEVRKPQTGYQRTIAFLELLYHSIVRSVRKSGSNNAIISLLSNMMQTVVFIGAFFIMFQVLGVRGAAIRGDFLLYIMSGIFMFMTHTKTVGQVSGAEGPTSAMMKHAPMNTMIATISEALSSLYLQMLTLLLVLFLYHVAMTPVVIDQPIGALAMVLMAWFSGVAVGMVMLAAKPWAPGFVGLASTIYQRVNMIASGKMFVANSLPSFMYVMFSWNPLFHIIDQSRGFVFINYTPHKTSATYPVVIAVSLVVIGLMGEFYTRKHASESWAARS